MRELLQEIFATISRNKLRTVLTGFSVAWGIFMLIILLGSGNGLKNGVMSNFEGMSMNSGTIWSGRTSIPYGGYQRGRKIRIENSDLELLRKHPNIEDVSGRISIQAKQISKDKNFTVAILFGVEPVYINSNGLKIIEGRFINQADVREGRKVVVVHEDVASTLSPKLSPMGGDVEIDRIIYQVIGIYKDRYMGNSSDCYIPITTMQNIYSKMRYVDEVMYIVKGVETKEDYNYFEKEVREILAVSNQFDPNDYQAVYIRGAIRDYLQTKMIFNSISMFIWIIGLGTLMAGIVGVSNIMLVTVRERTNEFGVRKAMGATPASLVKLVLVESVLITAAFGYIGMMLGIGTMELVNMFLERSMEGQSQGQAIVVFLNPTLNLSIIFSATLVLIIAGVVAGYMPARRAVQIKTIDAMRYNK